MARCRTPCTESRYDSLGTGGGGADSVGTWTTATPSLLQDPGSIIDSASYGTTSSITLKSGNPGTQSPGGGAAPTCPIWTWTISDTFDYVASTQVLVQVKLTGTPNQNYFFFAGVYDGAALAGGGGNSQGLWGSIRCDNGNTGGGEMGATGTNGAPAAAINAAGGYLCTAFNLDADNSECRGILVRSKSNTGPAYGEQDVGGAGAEPGNWTGSKLHGWIAIGASALRTGGAFTGIEIRYATIPAFL